MAAKNDKVWLWQAAQEDLETPNFHPAEVPTDETTAKSCWEDNRRGPARAKIVQVKLTKTVSKTVVEVCDVSGENTREVEKHMIIPWYEGLLILNELNQREHNNMPGYLQATWFNQEYRALLEQGKAQFKSINGRIYAEKRMLHTACTGKLYVDKNEREWNYRREQVNDDDIKGYKTGEDTSDFFGLKDVVGYMPPWEAFFHDKCGFYQDFFLVKWARNFESCVTAENGCPAVAGTTWEPDQCLPPHMDPFRLNAKKSWLKGEELKQAQAAKKDVEKEREESKRPAPVPTPRAVAVAVQPPVKKAKFRRDGTPLVNDLFLPQCGHDFAPEGLGAMTDVRKGWPKAPEDYPKGYGVARPPGFCWDGCDCMDDQRVQALWETRKSWLADSGRALMVQTCINVFSNQTQFVRRRGQVSGMNYFETNEGQSHDETPQRAALDLAGSMSRRVAELLQQIPMQELLRSPAVFVPYVAVLSENLDVDPLRYIVVGNLPEWLKVDAGTGTITICGQPGPSFEVAAFAVSLKHSEETRAGQIACRVVKNPGAPKAWMKNTELIITRYEQVAIDAEVREVLNEHFEDIWNFKTSQPVDCSLGTWFQTTAKIIRMLKTCATAHVRSTASRVLPIQQQWAGYTPGMYVQSPGR